MWKRQDINCRMSVGENDIILSDTDSHQNSEETKTDFV